MRTSFTIHSLFMRAQHILKAYNNHFNAYTIKKNRKKHISDHTYSQQN